MSWFKVDDRLFCHPKWLACSPHARALWVTAGSWAGAQEDRGRVPRHALSILGGRPRDAAELERNGLWDPTDDGWVFHDWAEFQPSPEQIKAKRDAAAERQRRARASRRDSECDEDVSDEDVTDPPSRPVPVPDEKSVVVDEPGTYPQVPDDVWTAFAKLKAERSRRPVENFHGFAKTTIANAKKEHGEEAARWWSRFDITPPELAAALVDGGASRHWQPRRKESA